MADFINFYIYDSSGTYLRAVTGEEDGDTIRIRTSSSEESIYTITTLGYGSPYLYEASSGVTVLGLSQNASATTPDSGLEVDGAGVYFTSDTNFYIIEQVAASYISKIELDGDTLIDLTADTAVASDVASGKTFHLATGEQVTGTVSTESNKNVTPSTSQQVITPDSGYANLAQVTVAAIPYSETDNAAGGLTVTIG